MSKYELALFMAADTLDTVIESLAEAAERGLSPPDDAERERRRVVALKYLCKHGTPEWAEWSAEQLKQGREAAMRRKNGEDERVLLLRGSSLGAGDGPLSAEGARG